MNATRLVRTLTVLMCVQASLVCAQPREPRGQALQLGALQQQALDADARIRELRLYESQTALRLRTIEDERLPSVTALGQAQYQSDVPTSPFTQPNGQPLFSAPKDTYDASLRIDQRLFDATVGPRLAVEQAQLAESQARVRATLFDLRREVRREARDSTHC
jgi:outer membrane protein TolC